MVLHTGRYNFTKGAKIKNQDLLLQSRIIYWIITLNILPKKGHYDEVTFMDLCLIDCMIRGRPINLSYIIIRNLIMTHDQKQKSIPYGQCLTTIFEHFEILLIGTDRTPYSKLMEINNITLNKMKYVLNKDGAWVSRDQMKVHAKE